MWYWIIRVLLSLFFLLPEFLIIIWCIINSKRLHKDIVLNKKKILKCFIRLLKRRHFSKIPYIFYVHCFCVLLDGIFQWKSVCDEFWSIKTLDNEKLAYELFLTLFLPLLIEWCDCSIFLPMFFCWVFTQHLSLMIGQSVISIRSIMFSVAS